MKSTFSALLLGASLTATFACSDNTPEPIASTSSPLVASTPSSSSVVRGPRPAYLLDSMRSILEQTAAIVEGTVSNINYSFDDQLGPRTNVTLSGVVSRIGSLPGNPSQVMLPMFGGPSLDQSAFYAASPIAQFAIGTRYVVFLANHDWFFSPVLRDLALRVETVNGVDVLIDNDGQGITGFDATYLRRTGKQFAQPIGRERMHPFERTPLATLSADDTAQCMPKDTFLAALSSYSDPNMKLTAFDGSFSSAAMPWTWNKLPTATPPAAPLQPADAAAANESEGGTP